MKFSVEISPHRRNMSPGGGGRKLQNRPLSNLYTGAGAARNAAANDTDHDRRRPQQQQACSWYISEAYQSRVCMCVCVFVCVW